jgi:hypothetical protein
MIGGPINHLPNYAPSFWEHPGMFVDEALAGRNINQMEDINVATKGERVLRNVVFAVETAFHYCNLHIKFILVWIEVRIFL